MTDDSTVKRTKKIFVISMDKLGRTKMMAVDFSLATLNFYNNVKPSRKKMHVKTAVQLLLNTFLHVHKSLYF